MMVLVGNILSGEKRRKKKRRIIEDHSFGWRCVVFLGGRKFGEGASALAVLH
jgi:hypothetical protein